MVKVTVGKHTYYMDNYLRSNLNKLREKIKKDWDFVIIVSGSAKTRVGKSVMAQQMAYYLDPSFTVNKIFFTAASLKKEAIKSKKHTAMIYDEARRGLSSKRALEQYSKELCEFLDDIAQLNLFVIIVLPDFFDLNKDIAIGRSIALVNVYYQGDLQRGYFTFFNDNKKRMLYLIGKKKIDYFCVPPDFRGRFPNYYVVPEKEYRRRKKAYLSDKNTRDYQIDRYKRKVNQAIVTLRRDYGMTWKELSEIFKYSYTFLKEKGLDLIRTTEEELDAAEKENKPVSKVKVIKNLNLPNRKEEKKEEEERPEEAAEA